MKINFTLNIGTKDGTHANVSAGAGTLDNDDVRAKEKNTESPKRPPLTEEEKRRIRRICMQKKLRRCAKKCADVTAEYAVKAGKIALKYAGEVSESAKALFDEIYAEVCEDVAAVRERDPAARSDLEVCLLYSGVHAMLAYRVAHKLYVSERYLSARAISQLARFCTGIEIHPGAEIGHGLVIDHGSGVVIGETCVIGDNCTIYQGVTLGGTGKDVGKRHPTLGNNVMVGAGAKVLGPFRIGDGAKIAAGAVVLKEIPAGATAVGIPARVVRRDGERTQEDLDQIHIPDPVAQQLSDLEAKLATLSAEISALKAKKEEE